MSERKRSRYEHPLADKGVRSHRFHKEYLLPVSGHLATVDELGVRPGDMDMLSFFIGKQLTDTELALLGSLRLPVIPGLPLEESTKDEYLRANTVFITDKPTDMTTIGYSYPNAGRSITRREGWVTEYGQVMTEHSIKGVGKTKSVGRTLVDEKQTSGNYVGIVGEIIAAREIIGTTTARYYGVLTPILLPPIFYNDIIHNKKLFPANEYIPEDKLVCVQRAWSSDIRVSSMYRGIEESYLRKEDLALMAADPTLTRNVFMSRVNRFLRDARVVDEFNREHNTDFFIGCSPYLIDSFTYEDYAYAFREQMARNIARMIEGNYWHENLSTQNVSVAAEIGDWDLFSFSTQEGEMFEQLEKTNRYTLEEFKAKKAYKVHLSGYVVQALVTAVLGNGAYITAEEWWSLIQQNFTPTTWSKDVSYAELLTLSNKTNSRGVRMWESNFYDFAAVFRK